MNYSVLRRVALATALAAPADARAQAAPAPRLLTVAEAREDLDTLRHALEEAHGALYRFVPKPALDRKFDAYRARITQPMAPLQFAGLVAEMVAEFGDGHSRMEPDDSSTAALARAPLLPLRVNLERDSLVILYNDTPADTLLKPGMVITRINGRDVQGILAAIAPKVSRDGFIETGRRQRISSNFASYYWLFVDQSPRFTVEARDERGIAVAATVDGVNTLERARNANPLNEPIRAQVRRLSAPVENIGLRTVDGGIAHLRIRSFGGDRFPAQLDSVVALANASGARAMILDLRGNGGGVDMFGVKLVSEFASAPFRYFDRIHLTTIRPSFATWRASTFEETKANSVADPAGGYLATPAMHPGVAEQQPAPAPFRGRLVVLMDGGTFSTAADVTAVLRSMNRATFVGEESGGAYEGNTSGLNADVRLPNSRLRYRVQMFGYVNAVKPAAAGRGTIPDYVVPFRIADLRRGADPALERAIALATAP